MTKPKADDGRADVCTDGKPHRPDWQSVTVGDDGGETYIDIGCAKCGRNGCVGNSKTLTAGICW